eukprot:1369318-Amorphochlora_amoeboformis.AAC.1
MINFVLKKSARCTRSCVLSDDPVRSCERDMAVTSRSVTIYLEARYYQQGNGNLRAISGIQPSPAICSIRTVILNTLSISTLRAACIYAIYMLL